MQSLEDAQGAGKRSVKSICPFSNSLCTQLNRDKCPPLLMEYEHRSEKEYGFLRPTPAKSRAEMIRKVYEVDPLICPQYGGRQLNTLNTLRS